MSTTSSTITSSSSSTPTSITTTSSASKSTTSSTSTSTTISTSKKWSLFIVATTTIRTLWKIICGNQTFMSSSDFIAKWSFENTFLDKTNNFNATPINSPSFVNSGYVNKALSLSSIANQYVTTSYIPLVNVSFTIEAWLYPTGFPNTMDHSILGLCTHPGSNQCLHLTIRKVGSLYKLYMAFFGDSCLGNGSVTANKWTHVAFVFDQTTLIQSLYLNGVLDNACIATAPLKSSIGNVTIGSSPGIVSAYGNNSFQGYIDELTIANQAKSSCEILDDASLAACFMFDSGFELIDSGPNDLQSQSNASFVSSGHSQQAISFNRSVSSYSQTSSFTGLGTTNKPFTISLWIRPRNLTGVVVHVSSTVSGGGWCLPFIGFATNGSLVAQIWSGMAKSVLGPRLAIASMSHIVETWSSTNGIRLYINGVLVGSELVATSTYSASGVQVYVTLGTILNGAGFCVVGLLGSTLPFDGEMDDLRIYSRELTASEVNILYLM
ncbi:unnamed protein product [Rotaria sp. Silwood1]|nr:unnamed protein product [Rotaria sp. Silwood1]CAF1446213.1 unnamed protein product [Rotaria sp. Silwood1]CAF3624656.1 unnamed protein product [Rotaria sp. Silwood1]CAF4846791.1 unnamed protein product [Rotaria sp. Silwood1]